MDNASVHRIDNAQIKRLKATQIAFFSANTTPQLQPMDAGIIQAFKLYYRQSLHSHIMHKVKADITCNPLKDVTIVLAIVWVFRAWCKVRLQRYGWHRDGGCHGRSAPAWTRGRWYRRTCSERCRNGRQHIPTHREGRGLVYRSFCRHRCWGAEDRRARAHGQGWSGCGGARIGGWGSDPDPHFQGRHGGCEHHPAVRHVPGDEQVVSFPVDMNHYQEIVASRQFAEQEQTQITDYYVCSETVYECLLIRIKSCNVYCTCIS